MKHLTAAARTTARQRRLYHRLQLAAHLSGKHADQRMKAATGLTTAQVSVLSVLAASGPVSQRRIAAELGVNESAVTTMVRRLEAAGCIERNRSADDQRTMVVALTAEGRTSLRLARTAFAAVNKAIGRTFTAEEVEALASALERLAQTFDPTTGAERDPSR